MKVILIGWKCKYCEQTHVSKDASIGQHLILGICEYQNQGCGKNNIMTPFIEVNI